VTTVGVLGEQFLAVEPGTTEQPVLWDGAVVTGVSHRGSPLAERKLRAIAQGVCQHRPQRDEDRRNFDGLHSTLKGTGDFFRNNRRRSTQS